MKAFSDSLRERHRMRCFKQSFDGFTVPLHSILRFHTGTAKDDLLKVVFVTEIRHMKAVSVDEQHMNNTIGRLRELDEILLLFVPDLRPNSFLRLDDFASVARRNIVTDNPGGRDFDNFIRLRSRRLLHSCGLTKAHKLHQPVKAPGHTFDPEINGRLAHACAVFILRIQTFISQCSRVTKFKKKIAFLDYKLPDFAIWVICFKTIDQLGYSFSPQELLRPSHA